MFIGLLTLACLLLAIAIQATISRIQNGGNRVRQFLLGGMTAGTGLLAALPLLPGITWPAALAAATAYAFACELYIFIFTMVTSSVSVSLLISRRAQDSVVEQAPVLAPEVMVLRRLESMAGAGMLTAVDGSYCLTPKSRRLVALHRRLRSFFHAQPSAHRP